MNCLHIVLLNILLDPSFKDLIFQRATKGPPARWVISGQRLHAGCDSLKDVNP